MTKQLLVKAYYNDSISNKDNGYQVNLMYYRENEVDYFDEEFITTTSPNQAEKLAEQINLNGYNSIKPKN